jgi:hypothetical protein
MDKSARKALAQMKDYLALVQSAYYNLEKVAGRREKYRLSLNELRSEIRSVMGNIKKLEEKLNPTPPKKQFGLPHQKPWSAERRQARSDLMKRKIADGSPKRVPLPPIPKPVDLDEP